MAGYKVPIITGTELSVGDILRWGGSDWVNYADSAYSPSSHLHDGDTLQLDGVNSDGGAFAFNTTGAVTFNQSIASANYEATNKLTACATNAGALDFSAASKTLTVEDSAIVSQDYSSDGNPAFAGLTITNSCVLGSNSVVFQPAADSTTFLQVLDADGGIPVLTIDTTNERVGIGIAAPEQKFEIEGSDNYRVRFNVTGADKRVLFEVRNPTDSINIQAGAYGSTFPGSVGGINLASTSWMTGYANLVVYGNKVTGGQVAILANGTERFRIDRDGNVGIRTNDPQTILYALEVNDEPATMRGIQSVLIGATGHSSHVTGRRARGTEAVPVVLDVDDGVGAFTAEGYNGSAFERAGYLRWVVTDVSGGNLSTKFTIATSTLGSETDKLTISNSGTVGINTIVPATRLQVVGDCRFGDQATNYISIGTTGDVTFTGSAGFYPRVLNQSAEPAAGTGATQCDTGELVVWTDTDDAKCYFCYNHSGTVKTVELT